MDRFIESAPEALTRARDALAEVSDSHLTPEDFYAEVRIQRWPTTAGLRGGLAGRAVSEEALAFAQCGHLCALASPTHAYAFSTKTPAGLAAHLAYENKLPLTKEQFSR